MPLNTRAAPATTSPANRVTRRRSILTEKTAPYFFLLPLIVLFAGFKIYPYLYALYLSFTEVVGGVEVFVGFDNYLRLVNDPLIYTAMGNTVLILLVQVPLMLVLAIGAAVAFNSILLKFRAFFRISFFLPVVMGLVAYGILFGSILATQTGIANALLELINLPRLPWLGDPFWAKISIVIAMTWHYTGYNAVIYLAQLQSIPHELYEAAASDGAGAWKRFWHVTLPGLRPAILLTVVLSTIGTLQLFDEPYILTGGGPDNATLTIGMYLYQNGFRYFEFGYASAIGYSLALLIAIISIIQVKLLGEKK